jgi:ribonuclease-3
LRESLNSLQARLNYQFNDPGLLEIALTHRSIGQRNNERLEFLGDSIIGFIIADHLYHHFNAADEGQLSRLRAALVKKEALAEIARSLEIGNFLKLGQGELKSGGHARDSILADAVEAIIAAIYLDSDYLTVRDFVSNLYQSRLASLSLKTGAKDPKTRLQELLQADKIDLPVYEVVESSGPQHKQLFVVSCTVKSLSLNSIGRGGSKRKAEQDAAVKILEQYEQHA